MIKLLLILTLTVISNSVMAEWVEFTENDEEGHTIYVDSATIHKNGKNVKMWILSDYMKAQELAYLPLYLSIKNHTEFNCEEKQIKKLYVSYHSKQMGGGKVIYSDNSPDKWSTASPDSIDWELCIFACRK